LFAILKTQIDRGVGIKSRGWRLFRLQAALSRNRGGTNRLLAHFQHAEQISKI
jgi:hypothetical protein